MQLYIINNNIIYYPSTEEGVTWTTERKSAPGVLKANVIMDGTFDVEEGDIVQLYDEMSETYLFFGFIFTRKFDKSGKIAITAYDQLRYFKNKDTYIYTNKTASEFIKMLADDFQLNVGEIADTKYKIASRIESDTTLFDMIGNALDQTLLNTGMLYTLYDDFGKLTLKSIADTLLDVLVDEETAESYDYSSSIDESTYNRIKLTYSDTDGNMQNVYTDNSKENISKWGILQYYGTLQEGENGQEKAKSLLNLYNSPTKSLKISNVLGDIRVRAGMRIFVRMKTGDMSFDNNVMLVEKCVHTFKLNEHLMDLTLRGGDINSA